MAGETEQARLELARLAIVKARREEAAKKREQEGRKPGMSTSGLPDASDDEESGSDSDDSDDKPKGKGKPAAAPKLAAEPISSTAASIAAKKKAAAAAPADEPCEADGGPPKLKAMDIKKMNGDALKEHLKARSLDVQGQTKALMKRLVDYEAARP